ncbi:MAG: hypothetical protein KC561_04980, partial [Myxococcales bacterium]|nr:hypothetical protein [Myxococcales bacterium]
IDWPPTEPGIYEESSSNKLRVLSPAAFSAPNMLTMCNVSGEPAAQTVAYVPLDAKFVMLAPGQEDWEYGIYHSVDVPNTGECVRVPAANEVEGVTVRPDEENPQMVWILPPAPLEQGSTYMVYVKGAETQGVIVTAGPAPQ